MDIVLGVSMAPPKVRMVLVEGENADGVTVDQDDFDAIAESSSTVPAQVISAILGTRESAEEGGYQLLSSGVTWTDPVEAAALRDALAAHKIENVMLVSAFMAAAAMAQAVGTATSYARTALLFVEPHTATLAVVNTADGSVTDVHRKLLPVDEDQAVAKLVEMVSRADSLETQPQSVFVVGSGVDIRLIKPALEAATSLALSMPEEPEMALAQGAARAATNAPLFASATAAWAYALDPRIGNRPDYRVPYLTADDKAGIDNVAYSAVPDDGVADEAEDAGPDENAPSRRSMLLVGSSLSVVVITAVVTLAMGVRPTVEARPSPSENIVVPTQQAPAPAVVPEPELEPLAPVAATQPLVPHMVVPVPAAAPPAPVHAAPPPAPVAAAPPPAPPPMAPVPPPAPPPRVHLVPWPLFLLPREHGLLPRLGGGLFGRR